jgi:hypothetical protein
MCLNGSVGEGRKVAAEAEVVEVGGGGTCRRKGAQ